MSDPQDTQETEGRPESRAVTVVKERLIAHSPVALWDSADFDQIQRVAVVLARSGLVPATLCTARGRDETGKEVDIQLPEAVVAARCVLICNQARLWGADPLNVLQCTSLINGRLMYEGKLVNAVVQHLTGVKLRFQLGRWETDHFEACEPQALNGIGERLAVLCFDPNDPERNVSGSVGMWKTTRANNPWTVIGNWPRQLRYRAAREWARAYEPGAILGILADGDEDLPDLDAGRRPSGVMGRLSGEQNGSGFNHGQVIEHTAPKKERRSRRAPEPQPETETVVHDAETGEILDGDDLPPALKEAEGNAPGATESAPSAEPSPASLASATDASSASAAETSSPADISEASESGPTQAEAAPEIEAEVVEETGADDLPPDLSSYIDKVEAARDFTTVKTALRDLMATEFWKGVANDQANRIRRNTWETMVELFPPEALPNPAKDASAFRLWIEAQDDPEAIDDMRNKLESDPDFAGKQVAFKEQIRGATQARIHALEP